MPLPSLEFHAMILFRTPSNLISANTALLALLAARDGLYSTVYKKWAMSQIDYMLGDNKYNISYEVGFGDNYPLHIQHKGR